MKLQNSNRRTKAMTLTEVLVVVAVLALLIAMFLPALMPARRMATRINCTNNLKQIGWSFRAWEEDNNGKFPMQVSVTNGGAMELAAKGDVAAVFQVMSNELSNSKIVLCPEDTSHIPATNWTTDFGNRNISYFVGLDVTNETPNLILAGDDNFEINGTEVKPGMLQLTTNTPVAWTKGRHHFQGQILCVDGSVSRFTNSELALVITHQYAGPSGFTNRFRLAIP